MRLPDSVLINTKKTIDIAAKPLNVVKDFLMSLDPQQKNQFLCIIVPEVPPKLADVMIDADTLARSALDAVTFEFYVQNIDIPTNDLAYMRLDHLQAVQDITWADEVTMTFLEGELAPVRLFLLKWQSLTYKRNITKGGYTFEDNQWAGRKKIIIMPQTRMKVPSPVWLEIRGARFKSMGNFSFDQQSSDPMMIEVTMAVDSVYLTSIL